MPAEEMHHGAQDSARSEAPKYGAVGTRQGNEEVKTYDIGSNPNKLDVASASSQEVYDYAYPDKGVETQRSSQETHVAVTEALTEDVDALKTKLAEYENRIAQLEALLGGSSLQRTEDQPRRVRGEGGDKEQLVKYKDVSGKVEYKWEKAEPKAAQDEVEAGWDTFTREREAGMFNDVEPGQRAEDDAESPVSSVADNQEAGETSADAAEESLDTLEGGEQGAEAPSAADTPEEASEEEAAEEEAPEDEGAEKPAELTKTAEIAKLEGLVDAAISQYAELTAKARGSYNGHFLHNSKFWAKIPGLKWVAEKANAAADKDLIKSREEYETQLGALQAEIAKATREQFEQESDERSIQEANAIAIASDVKLEMAIMEKRMNNDPKANRFMNWWVTHDGLGMKVLKYGVPGAIIGGVTAVAGAPLLLGVAVAGTGAGIMAHLTNRRRANSVAGEDGVAYAETNMQQDGTRKAALRDELAAKGEFVTAQDLTSITEERTGREKTKNRTNLAGSVAMAAGGAKLAGIGVDMLTPDANAAAPEVQVEDQPEAEPEPAAPEAPQIQGNEFTVESGSSYTKELMDFAGANGHSLTPDQSWQLHSDLMQQFGQDYIDINGSGGDTYVDGGDVRLTEPGAARWNDGVGQYIQQWMASRGLW